MERAVFVYTTWPSIVEASRAGSAIVEKRLAACVNILPGMVSHYWWEGKLERSEEAVMILVPFVVVDLICAQLLVLLGLSTTPTTVIALPAKILLFLAADGWRTVIVGLIEGYR